MLATKSVKCIDNIRNHSIDHESRYAISAGRMSAITPELRKVEYSHAH